MMPACLALAAVCAALLLRCRRENGLLRKRLKELERGSSGDEEREFRLERFDVIWYPAVSFSPAAKTVTGSRAGLPHCKACILPLSVSGPEGKWACPQCRASFAASLSDLAVSDSITREALRYFLERNKGYRVTSEANRA